MLSDASRNLPSGLTGSNSAPLDDIEVTRRSQRAVWCLLALIGSFEVLFGVWLVGLIGSR
jgi:hypothetical protein